MPIKRKEALNKYLPWVALITVLFVLWNVNDSRMHYKTQNDILNESIQKVKKDLEAKVDSLQKEREQDQETLDSLKTEEDNIIKKDGVIVKKYEDILINIDDADWDSLHSILSSRGIVK